VINLNILIENNNLECYQKFSFIPNSDKIAWISRDNNYIYYFNYYDLVSKERKRIDITALIPNKNTGDYISIRDFSFNKAGDELTLITEFMVLYSFKICPIQ
jgi:hypothetical protein